jgi:hypothetical protein
MLGLGLGGVAIRIREVKSFGMLAETLSGSRLGMELGSV